MKQNYCLLVVPPYISGKGSILKSFDYTMPPVGLLSIAGWLRYKGIEVKILDYSIVDYKNNTVEDILHTNIKKNGLPEWIGITVCTPVAYSAYRLSDLYKTYYPEVKIVLGGPHITVLAERIFEECNSADYLITGEGEYALSELINNNLSSKSIIAKNSSTHIKKNEPKEVVINELPMPAYDLLDFEKYVPPPASLQSKKPGIGIITSRGCPYQCTFCARITGKKLRNKTLSQVLEEIKYLQNNFNIKQFHFYDDTITCNKKYITDLCNMFITEELNLHWSCFARVDTVNEDLLHLMKKAGCFVIMYGVESLDEGVLKDIKKGITVDQIKSALISTRKAKIESRISLIIGTATETRESLDRTKRDLLKLDTDFFQTFIAVPMPGSQFYVDAKKEGRVINENWDDYNLSKVMYNHPVFTEKELFKEQRLLYLRFYLRLKIIFRMIAKLNSPTAIKNVLIGLKGFIKIISS
jgi:anaerobic magnesium-protoporphyrin IX monomethyl ester cyclase